MDALLFGPSAGLLGELELQSRWFGGEFGRAFLGTEGESVQIVQYGTWNRSAGPDFSDAAVQIDGGEVRRGSIEIDPDVRDWEHHGHSQNPAYEDVVLHVFWHTGERRVFTRTASHKKVVQVQITNDPLHRGAAPPLAHPGRCARVLATLPLPSLRETLLEAASVRFEHKSRALARTRQAHGDNEALFQALAVGMGYPNNTLAFRLLAQKLPLRKLLLEHDSAEGILFGVSGFLPDTDLSGLPRAARAYAKQLWERWWPHRARLQALHIPKSAWCLSGQRPANHPLRRLGALASMLRHWRALRKSLASADWKASTQLLTSLQHPFWSEHYTFDSIRTKRPLALLGEERVKELLANTLLPFGGHWDALLKLRHCAPNRRSRIAATRLLPNRLDCGKLLQEAACQQGLLQLYEDFCRQDASDCKNCPFPEQTAKAHSVLPSLQPLGEAPNQSPSLGNY